MYSKQVRFMLVFSIGLILVRLELELVWGLGLALGFKVRSY